MLIYFRAFKFSLRIKAVIFFLEIKRYIYKKIFRGKLLCCNLFISARKSRLSRWDWQIDNGSSTSFPILWRHSRCPIKRLLWYSWQLSVPLRQIRYIFWSNVENGQFAMPKRNGKGLFWILFKIWVIIINKY